MQTTLWGNLILGPTARDVGNPQHDLTKDQCNSFILSKCKQLVDAFDASQAFHAFAGTHIPSHLKPSTAEPNNTPAGARAKSSRKLPDGSDECDWIIEPCRTQVRHSSSHHPFKAASHTFYTAAHDARCRHRQPRSRRQSRYCCGGGAVADVRWSCVATQPFF